MGFDRESGFTVWGVIGNQAGQGLIGEGARGSYVTQVTVYMEQDWTGQGSLVNSDRFDRKHIFALSLDLMSITRVLFSYVLM